MNPRITVINLGVTTPKTTLIGLVDPKTPTNVGSVMRAARCYQAQAVRYTGERFGHAARYHTDTKSTTSTIPLLHVADLVEGLPEPMKIVCVELAEGATLLTEFIHPDHALYIFGPEDGSIPQDIINAADSGVYIPTLGCMNLAATVNVVLYDRLAKSTQSIDSDERIKSSRDINNRLKVNSCGASVDSSAGIRAC